MPLQARGRWFCDRQANQVLCYSFIIYTPLLLAVHVSDLVLHQHANSLHHVNPMRLSGGCIGLDSVVHLANLHSPRVRSSVFWKVLNGKAFDDILRSGSATTLKPRGQHATCRCQRGVAARTAR